MKNSIINQTEDIPQFDGAASDLELLDQPNPGGPAIRTASFVFNQEKQTDKIKKDAVLNDFEVNVNNNDENATVKCSTGFYIQVARSSIGSFNDHTTLACGVIAITIDKVTITEDQVGTEATKVIYLSFMSQLRRIGGLTVHLHHSSRTIQIQGSSTMPVSSKVVLWFLKNVVLTRFKEQAKAKN